MTLHPFVNQVSDHGKKYLTRLQFNIIWKKLGSKIDSRNPGVQR